MVRAWRCPHPPGRRGSGRRPGRRPPAGAGRWSSRHARADRADRGRMLGLGWGLASAVGAVSGILVAPVVFLEPNMMQSVIIYAFAAAVLGGIDSPAGAVVGGLLLGVVLA